MWALRCAALFEIFRRPAAFARMRVGCLPSRPILTVFNVTRVHVTSPF